MTESILSLAALKEQPPKHIVDLAVEVSGWSPCRSKRGAVVFLGDDVVAHGYNHKPNGFECDGSERCKATCRDEAVHAEQYALLNAGNSKAWCADLLHVKTVDGRLVPSGDPSCVQCSKLALAVGVAGVWLYHADGWRRYLTHEFHELSLTPLLQREAEQQKELEDLRGRCSRQAVTIHERQESWHEQQAEVERLKAEVLDWREKVGDARLERDTQTRRAIAAESALSALRQDHDALRQQASEVVAQWFEGDYKARDVDFLIAMNKLAVLAIDQEPPQKGSV